YPARQLVAVVRANGQTFVLEFGNKTLADMARKLDGLNVEIMGTFAGFRSFPVMCVPESNRYPVLSVVDVKACQGEAIVKTSTVTVHGQIDTAYPLMSPAQFPIVLDADEPLYRITAGGVTYGLDFGNNHVLASTVNKLGRLPVVVSGRLEYR